MTDFQKWVRSVLETKSDAPPTEFEQKSITFELKADDDGEKNIIQGYASTFNGEPDAHGDIVAPGAFAKTIAERGDEIKFLFAHDWYQIIGRVIEIREDSYGLWFKAKISETERGKEIITLVKDKVLTRISIGYRTKEYNWDAENGIRTLLEVDLFELSVVPMPANSRATITGVKEQTSLQHPPVTSIEEKAGRALSAKTESALREALEALAAASKAMKSAQKEVADVLKLVDNNDADDTDDVDVDDDDDKGATPIVEPTPPVTITVDEPKMSPEAIQEMIAAAVEQALAKKAEAEAAEAEKKAQAEAEAKERESLFTMLNQITQLTNTTEAQ